MYFLNQINQNYQYQITQQLEDYQAELNLNYSPFLIDDINFESFPPLKSHYGSVDFKLPFQSILNRTVRGVSTKDPMLATFETKGRREAVLFGENIWQWRAQSYMNSKSFNQFDDFMGKLVLYLASNKRRDRLNIEYGSFYNGNTNIVLKAQFFDKNANVTKLQQLATNSSGTSYFIDSTERLIDDLLNDNRYATVQKSNKNSLPLIDWKFLLLIIALSLSAEWFLRKYNGLI